MKEKKEHIEEHKEQPSLTEKTPAPRRNRQFLWIIGAMLILVSVFFASSYFFNQLRSFEHEGLTFTKEKFGEIPVFHYYYYITPKLKYNLYLRKDPRMNTVPFTGKAVDEGIEFFQETPIYLSVNPEGLTECEYGRVGISQLATFLADNQLQVIGSAPDEKLAKEANVKYATCAFRPNDMVILLEAGDKTQIVRQSDLCFKIQIANCEVLEAVEKFQVQSILDARVRRGAGN